MSYRKQTSECELSYIVNMLTSSKTDELEKNMFDSRSDPAVRTGCVSVFDAGMGISGHAAGSEALILYGNFSIFFHYLSYYLCELPNLRNTFYKGISL